MFAQKQVSRYVNPRSTLSHCNSSWLLFIAFPQIIPERLQGAIEDLYMRSRQADTTTESTQAEHRVPVKVELRST